MRPRRTRLRRICRPDSDAHLFGFLWRLPRLPTGRGTGLGRLAQHWPGLYMGTMLALSGVQACNLLAQGNDEKSLLHNPG